MNSILKYRKSGKIPMFLNEEGQRQWVEEHGYDGGELPEITVTASKPLTEFQQRDKANGVRLGRIKDDSNNAYRDWQTNFHEGNEATKKFGEWGGNLATGLAGAATMTNPASMYGYAAMGLGALPGNIDKIKQDIKDKKYLGAAADGVLTGVELLPALQITGKGMPYLKNAVNYVRDNYSISMPTNRLNSGIPLPNITKLSDEDKVINAWREAASNGDKQAASDALKKWWKLKAPDNKIVTENGDPLQLYHGTNANWTKYDINYFGSTDHGVYGKGLYTTPNYGYANGYGDNVIPLWGYGKKSFNGNMDNGHSLLMSNFNTEAPILSLEDVETLAQRRKMPELPKQYKAALQDMNGADVNRIAVGRMPEELVFKNTNNVKSSLPFTYDDNNKLIDITKRFNFSNPDIRYGIATLLGLGAGNSLLTEPNNYIEQ